MNRQLNTATNQNPSANQKKIETQAHWSIQMSYFLTPPLSVNFLGNLFKQKYIIYITYLICVRSRNPLLFLSVMYQTKGRHLNLLYTTGHSCDQCIYIYMNKK